MATRWQSGLHHPVSVYAKQVTKGKLRAQCCPEEIASCQRHLDDLKRQGTEDFPYVFDTTRADRIIRWFGKCIQVRGVDAGKPIALQPWQVFDLGVVFGWVHKDSGARRFKRTYNKRARGQYKSTENSGKCLYFMCGDVMYPPYHPEQATFEREPEVECAAVDRGQARRVFDDAKKIALASPSIARRLYIPRSNPVTHRTRGGFMRALSKDTKNKDSGAPSYFEVDEYHAHPTSEIYDIGLNSFGKRAQSLLDVITTAGDDAGNKPCYREEEYARRVLMDPAVVDETYFVMIRELPQGADPHDKRLWVMPNPCLRYPDEYSKYLLEQIETEYQAAYASGDPYKIRQFLTRRMCQWQVGSVNRYLDERGMALVRKLMIPEAAFDRLTRGRRCHCGYDLGKRIDLSGVGAVFDLADGRIAIKVHGLLPENAATRHEHTDRIPYRDWAKGGYVTLTPGDVTDNSYVNNWICGGEKRLLWVVEEIDYDGHNATDLAIQMAAERGEERVVEIAQTCAGLNQATKRFRELLLQERVVLCESPLLERCLENAIEVQNNFGDIKLSKKHKDDSARIDPVAAMMNALSRVLVRQAAPPDLRDRLESGTYTL